MQIGLSALDFVKYIVSNFNQIRTGQEHSLLLVVYNSELPKVAAISLNLSLNKDFWEIKTALPMRKAALDNRELLWSRERTPLQ